MAPYQYDTFSSRPYMGQLADLIQAPAQAQARAAEIGGQAQGQALAQAGQTIGGAVQHVTDPRVQMEQQQLALMKKAQGYQQATNQIVAQLTKQNPDGTRTLDRSALQQQLAQMNVPLPMQQEVFKSLDDVDASIQKFNQIRIDHRADFAHAALQSELGKSPQGIITLAGLAKANGLVTDQDLAPIYGALAAGQDPKAVLEGVRGFSEKYKDLNKPVVLPRPGAQLVSPLSGKVLAESPQLPPKPTEVSLAVDAAKGDPSAQAALEKLHAQKNPPSLEEQYLTAVTKGDQATAGTILKSIGDTANAKRDPAMQALTKELAGLRKDEATQRLETLKEKNAPADVSQSTFTTQSGRQYVDLSEFQTPEAREKARKAAIDAGVRPVNKEVADGLRAADTARANFQALWAQLSPFLAKDATGRLVQGPTNKLEKIFQSNPTLGAIGSWRTAAIQAVQALAEKGMGLRLNRSEIDLMLQNDIPQITDDAPTAKQRIDNMMTLLDNKEKDALERDRSQFAPSTPKPSVAPTLTPGLKKLSERP